MDFSLHEQRQLAEMERDLSMDRRLVALTGVLGSERRGRFRRLRCLAVLTRHPSYRFARPGGHRLARWALIVALVLTLLAPPGLIASLVIGIPALMVAAAVAIPLAVALLVLSYRWTPTV